MNTIVAVFIGGGLGSITRYGISVFIAERFKSVFPVATLVSNVLSCLLLGITVLLLSSKSELSPTWKLFIISGFCGGFSTFSTFSYETVELMRSNNMLYALANILISVVVCVVLVYILAKNTSV